MDGLKKRRPIRVFSDFDGTISAKDVGASLFNHFSSKRNSGTVQLWIEQKISSRECLWRECHYISATRQEMMEALNRIEIEAGFQDFVDLLSKHAIPLHIVSDGLDFYIDAFLSRAGFGGMDIHANKAHFVNGNLYPSFPYFARGCGYCGTCKGERVRALSSEDELTVYIGDGFSDRCAVGVADVLFARGDLVKLAQEKQVDWLPFANFYNIVDYFKANLLTE
ncbi:MAG: MtnX-like HAD-IB family phosphatase [Candidatus Zixiibacteriota bacterium]